MNVTFDDFPLFYFDTTYLCKLRWIEPGSAEVAAVANAADELVCALHGRAEFHSNDRVLLAAARLFGLRGVNVIT